MLLLNREEEREREKALNIYYNNIFIISQFIPQSNYIY